MRSTLRNLKATVLWHNTDMGSTAALLKEAAIPVSEDDCRACADPCDQGHEEYSSRFDVDMETQMLGSVKPYTRQVIVSTGKTDWAHDVSSVSGSLAHFLDATSSPHASNLPSHLHAPSNRSVPGVHSTASGTKTTILNGSHHTLSGDPKKDTVLILPDYKVVGEVERSTEGARTFWQDVFEPKTEKETVTHVLPYACVILLCSHKKRDNRCAIAAPKLEHGLSVALEREEWEVHTQLSEHDLEAPSPPPSANGAAEDAYLAQLKAAAQSKRALILKVSHIGGHKFAGNVIIYTPTGTSIWYGRVTPHNVDAIVRDTILGGKVIPELLRGGLNLARPEESSRKTLNDW
ncbi:hypothetical protein BDW22DRAFT_1367554 [Trametopsis cervina]|nr:hypothetical protein BDW22DRAFT_1367554 [Trametopsis cervina]